ncbi:thioesterase II family protein [Kutzneria sp. CA-103260]|uniref:thioesterase II family protein n=1 Tax=Kutzneria sp. CA-103260 TaxID=2802641 RepID=UPI001BA56976|nr:alpha/beta fold hydrolase [Kutzneria sp. CA-103260]QUQ68329.1 thioesterase [Kutzneria sp. CA-103260]
MTADIQLFCVPYAGGSARVYRNWRREFPDSTEVVPLEFAGRGSRAAQPFPDSVAEAALDLAETVRERATGVPYVLFGHSMGSLVVFEMAVALRALGLPSPALVVVSARNPPHIRAKWNAHVPELPDAELLDLLAGVGGVPPGLSPAIAAGFFLPLLRADLRIAVKYDAGAADRSIDAPILVLAGREDPLVDPELVAQWGRYTERGCTVVEHGGHHFSLFGQVHELAGALRAAGVPGTGGSL